MGVKAAQAGARAQRGLHPGAPRRKPSPIETQGAPLDHVLGPQQVPSIVDDAGLSDRAWWRARHHRRETRREVAGDKRPTSDKACDFGNEPRRRETPDTVVLECAALVAETPSTRRTSSEPMTEPPANAAAEAATNATSSKGIDDQRRAHRAIGALLVRGVLGQVIGILRQFVVLPLITPGQLGLLRYVLNLSQYSRFFHVGFLSTLWVRFPERQAAGDLGACAAMQRAAWRQTLVGFALFIPVVALLLRDTSIAPWLFPLIVVLSAFPLLGDYVAVSYQARGEFEPLVRIDLIVSVVGLAALIGLTFAFGLPGLLIAATLPGPLRVALGRRYLFPPKHDPQSAAYWRENLLFGVRTWLGQSAAHLAVTADVLLLGHFVGKESAVLGFYGLALTVAQFAARDLTAVTIVQQRQLQVAVGEHGGLGALAVAQATERYLAIDTLVSAWLSSAVTVGAALLLPLLFPRFSPALPLLGSLLAAAIIGSPLRYTRVVLMLADRAPLLVASSLVQLAVLAGGMALAHYWLSDAIWAYTGARLLSTAVGAALELLVAYVAMGRSREGLRLLARFALAVGPLLLLAVGTWSAVTRWALVVIICALPLLLAASFRVCFPGVPREAMTMLGGIFRGLVGRRRHS
ncbi:MAG: hypothetical protein IPG96_00420 [Proteobacteria bacterium]|nr:hypothetical protein [Pseudomonadota bacterium]